MSQATRSKVRAIERRRRAAARELAKLELGANIICANCTGMGIDFDVDCTAEGCENRPLGSPESGFTAHHAGPNCESTCALCEGQGTGRAALALALLTDQRQGFDVHRAREHALHLVDPLLGPLADLDVFTEWTRAKGLGPENREPGAFVHDLWFGGTTRVQARTPSVIPGGWPGKLAREWPGDSRAPMGRSLARLGQRILDMLEGQASECGRLGCPVTSMRAGGFVLELPPCPDCHGTGHNLRGKLPGVEWSPAAVVAVADSLRSGRPPQGRPVEWTMHLYNMYPDLRRAVDQLPTVGEPPEAGHYRARVCPRGEHRAIGWPSADGITLGKIRAWAWTGSRPPQAVGPNWDACFARETALLPGWRRGELEHARQRREREARREELFLAMARSIGAPMEDVVRLHEAVASLSFTTE